jgi:branched-chain amino acid transport system substrate-binding protein
MMAWSLAVGACGTRVPDGRIRAAAMVGGTRTVASGGSNLSGDTAAGVSAGGSAAGDSTAVGTSGAVASSGPVTGSAPGAGATGASAAVGGRATASSGQTAAGVSASGPATGSEVAIGVVGTFSGPVGHYVGDIAKGVQIWGQWANAHGGLNGHRVKVIVANDGGTPASFNSLAQQLVEQQHVIAFAFTTLGLAPGGNNSYLDSHHILTFGTEGGLDSTYNDPWLPTAVPSGHLYAQAMLHGYAQVAVPQGKTKLAVLSCSDFSLCDNFDTEWSSPAMQQETGLHVVYRGRPSLTTPDFTGICLDAQKAGAQGILNGLDTASIQRLADACARQGYHPLIGLADLLAQPSLAQDPNADGAVVGTKMAPWVNTDVPGIKTMYDAFAQFDPAEKPNGTFAGGWVAAQFLGAAAAHLPANPTPQDVLNGLGTVKGNNLGGLTYPLTYTAGQPSTKTVCWGTAVVKNRQFVPGPGGFQCK